MSSLGHIKETLCCCNICSHSLYNIHKVVKYFKNGKIYFYYCFSCVWNFSTKIKPSCMWICLATTNLFPLEVACSIYRELQSQHYMESKILSHCYLGDTENSSFFFPWQPYINDSKHCISPDSSFLQPTSSQIPQLASKGWILVFLWILAKSIYFPLKI